MGNTICVINFVRIDFNFILKSEFKSNSLSQN